MERSDRSKRIWRWVVGVMVGVPVGCAVVSIAVVALLSRGAVPASMMMLCHGQPRIYTWVPITEISPNMTRAVIASEDNLFVQHNGFSKKSIEKALQEKREKGHVRHGGSTITQQTAKNLFTTGKKTYLRKARETWYTYWMETLWTKKRIMEVYLNIIELGDGLYGTEAASQHYFHHAASHLTAQEAALMTAALPRPKVYSISHPGPYMLRRQQQILWLMPKMGKMGEVVGDR